MALVVEDGTIIAGANSLASAAFADAYFDERGVTAWGNIDDTDAALIGGTAYIVNRYRNRWAGRVALHSTQSLPWPRHYAYDDEGRRIATNVIPVAVKQAVCEAALRFGRGDTLNPDVTLSAGIISESKSVANAVSKSVTYARSTVVDDSRPTITIIDDLLRGYVRQGNVKFLLRA